MKYIILDKLNDVSYLETMEIAKVLYDIFKMEIRICFNNKYDDDSIVFTADNTVEKGKNYIEPNTAVFISSLINIMNFNEIKPELITACINFKNDEIHPTQPTLNKYNNKYTISKNNEIWSEFNHLFYAAYWFAKDVKFLLNKA